MRLGLANSSRTVFWPAASLLLIWCVGMFGRNLWTPDEPREAAIAWRMSWQADRAVPLLAGEAFCEKPPLTYWMAAIPINKLGAEGWAARLPNLLYAVITAISVGLLAARSTGRFAGWVAAAAISTFLLSYQVAIWLATDAPLLAAASVALLGAYLGFYAATRPERLRGYLLMHTALGLGFLSKSAVAWMVPALTILTLSLWEKRWRELFRWELYVGLAIQAAMILTWVWFVYVGENGPEHLKVFFWNNLVGRFAALDVPPEVQYATGHRNTPGKYLLELPVYLFPWTLLTLAALRRAWLRRRALHQDDRAVRFGIAASLPSLLLLSVAATARNIYFAPALPGIALLLAWWARETLSGTDRWDVRLLRATAALLLAGVVTFIAALALIAFDAWDTMGARALYILMSSAGLSVAAALSIRAWGSAPGQAARALGSLFLAYCALLIGPASQVYRQVDTWQDLAKIGRAVEIDAAGRRLVLLAPDETTRAMIDMYARTSVDRIDGPLDARAATRIEALAAAAPHSVFLVQFPAQRAQALGQLRRRPESPSVDALQPWMQAAQLHIARRYALPHGRRYALLEFSP